MKTVGEIISREKVVQELLALDVLQRTICIGVMSTQ